MHLFEGTPLDRPPRCERCGAREAECRCPPPETPRPSAAPTTLHLSLEKRRKGKLATVVRGLTPEHDVKALLSSLQAACGAGGSRDGSDLLLQGDQRERLRGALAALGFKIKG